MDKKIELRKLLKEHDKKLQKCNGFQCDKHINCYICNKDLYGKPALYKEIDDEKRIICFKCKWKCNNNNKKRGMLY